MYKFLKRTSQNIQIPINFPAESDGTDNEIRWQMNFNSSSTNHLFFDLITEAHLEEDLNTNIGLLFYLKFWFIFNLFVDILFQIRFYRIK